MGFFKDLNSLKNAGDEARKASGQRGGLGGLRDAVSNASTMVGDFQQDAATQQRLMQEGTPGQATITSLADTGVTINQNPKVAFELQVTVSGRDPYAVHHEQLVSRLQLPGLQPGGQVPVHVDPSDPQTLMIG